jgi:hypothetical protein
MKSDETGEQERYNRLYFSTKNIEGRRLGTKKRKEPSVTSSLDYDLVKASEERRAKMADDKAREVPMTKPCASFGGNTVLRADGTRRQSTEKEMGELQRAILRRKQKSDKIEKLKAEFKETRAKKAEIRRKPPSLTASCISPPRNAARPSSLSSPLSDATTEENDDV